MAILARPYDMGLLALFLIITHLSICHAQELAEDDYSCDDTGNCSDVNNCIAQYSQLDSYIVSNKDLLRKLTEAFFRTGKGASQFVKLTYKFQVYDGGNSTEDDVTNCTSNQTTYVWSTSVLYLLGPKPLFWQTLFAVNVPEASVTVELPCFCTDSYNNLLDRLTYLSKVYAVMEYHDQPLQYINRYYFHTKTEEDDHYFIISFIMYLMVFLQFSLFILMFMIAIRYLPPKIAEVLIKLSKIEIIEFENFTNEMIKSITRSEAENSCVQTILESGQQKVYLVRVSTGSNHDEELAGMKERNAPYIQQTSKSDRFTFYIINLPGNIHSQWKISEIPVFIVSIIINIGLLIIHIVSVWELVKYDNEVFNTDTSSNANDSSDTNNSLSDIAIFHFIFSFPLIIVTYISTGLLCFRKVKQFLSEKDINKDTRRDISFLFASTSITVNIIYLVSFYMPYILLAFVYNPIQTSIIYLGLGIWILCGYFFIWALVSICIGGCTNANKKSNASDETNVNEEEINADDEINTNNKTVVNDNKYNLCSGHHKQLNNVIIALSVVGLPSVVMYFSFIIVYALTLGSFDDFGIIQNFVPPLLIGLITFFAVKPAYREAKQRFNLVNDDQIKKLCNIQHENNDDNNQRTETPTNATV